MLTCGYLSVSGAYIPWESNVDTEKNILTCEIEHFSINSPITNCKQPSTYGGAESNGVTVLIYQQPCILSGGDICREDFVTCETAESEGVGCNKEYVVDGNNPVYMYEYNPNVMSSIVGFTKQYTECELRDWVYKDIEKK